MATYEQRAPFYLRLIAELDRTYEIAARSIAEHIGAEATDLVDSVLKVLELDRAHCPRGGATRRQTHSFAFAADLVLRDLGRMEAPAAAALATSASVTLELAHPGGVGEVLLDPDGGEWMRAKVVDAEAPEPTAVGIPLAPGEAQVRG